MLAAAGLPAHYDALSEEGGLPLGYLMHKGLDASAPFHRAPEPWVKVVAGPSKDDPQAYKEWWDAIGSFPGGSGPESLTPPLPSPTCLPPAPPPLLRLALSREPTVPPHRHFFSPPPPAVRQATPR